MILPAAKSTDCKRRLAETACKSYGGVARRGSRCWGLKTREGLRLGATHKGLMFVWEDKPGVRTPPVNKMEGLRPSFNAEWGFILMGNVL